MKKGKTLREVFERDNLVKALTEPMTPELVAQYLASIGRKGGQAKTAAKSAAAIANGKLGGRPKKPKRVARRSNSPHVSTQELKSWSSNIEVRVQMLESNLPLQAIQPPSPQ